MCNKQYIEETGRKLKYRFTDHLQDIRKNKDTAVATHFNQSHQTRQSYCQHNGKSIAFGDCSPACVAKLASLKQQIQELFCDKKFF